MSLTSFKHRLAARRVKMGPAAPARGSAEKPVVVIGGGISGLATAGLLARAGHRVTLLEQRSGLGGRSGRYERDGFRFDTGPSWYLMPEVIDHWFRLMGTSAAEQLDLVTAGPGLPDLVRRARRGGGRPLRPRARRRAVRAAAAGLRRAAAPLPGRGRGNLPAGQGPLPVRRLRQLPRPGPPAGAAPGAAAGQAAGLEPGPLRPRAVRRAAAAAGAGLPGGVPGHQPVPRPGDVPPDEPPGPGRRRVLPDGRVRRAGGRDGAAGPRGRRPDRNPGHRPPDHHRAVRRQGPLRGGGVDRRRRHPAADAGAHRRRRRRPAPRGDRTAAGAAAQPPGAGLAAPRPGAQRGAGLPGRARQAAGAGAPQPAVHPGLEGQLRPDPCRPRAGGRDLASTCASPAPPTAAWHPRGTRTCSSWCPPRRRRPGATAATTAKARPSWSPWPTRRSTSWPPGPASPTCAAGSRSAAPTAPRTSWTASTPGAAARSGPAHTLRQSAFLRPGNRSGKVEGLHYAGSSVRPGIGVPMCLISAELVLKAVQGIKTPGACRSLAGGVADAERCRSGRAVATAGSSA